ncbi:MAG: tyrosine-protein phosphatase [Acidobacteriota bacterium]
MTLIEVHQGVRIPEVEVPKELYWVLQAPAPLAGMKYPRSSFPWSNLKAAGFSQVVSLHPGSYNPAPLTMAFSEYLEDLVSGGPPRNEAQEREKIKKAVTATLSILRSGESVVVHCVGGRGRTGTVLGCTLRDLGFEAHEAIAFLDRVHKARGKPGWPESPWQSSLVYAWKSDA